MRGALHLVIGILLGATAGSSALSVPLIPFPPRQDNLSLCFSESVGVLSFSTDLSDPNTAIDYDITEQSVSAIDFFDIAVLNAVRFEARRSDTSAAALEWRPLPDAVELTLRAIFPAAVSTSADCRGADELSSPTELPEATWTAGEVRFTLAPLLLLLLIPALGLSLFDVRRNHRVRRRARLGCCLHCGFDLRGAVSGRCAECGKIIPAAGEVQLPSLLAFWLGIGASALWIALGVWIASHEPLVLSAAGGACSC